MLPLSKVIACFWFWIGNSGQGGWIDEHNLVDEKWEYQRLGLKQVESLPVLTKQEYGGSLFKMGDVTHTLVLNRYEDSR